MTNPDVKIIRDALQLAIVGTEVLEALDRLERKVIRLNAQNSAFMMALGSPVEIHVHNNGSIETNRPGILEAKDATE